jgi:F0F1-type ATP synthase epsilon subunit
MKRKILKEELFIAIFWSPFAGKIGFRGVASALTSINKVGKFDILPEHTNFITLIFNKLTIHTQDRRKIEYEFKRGVLEVSDNLVKVFLGI